VTFVRRSSGAGSAPSFVKQGRDQIRFVRACTCLRFTCRLVFALHVSGLLTPLCCNPDLMIVELSESSNYFILSVVLLVEEICSELQIPWRPSTRAVNASLAVAVNLGCSSPVRPRIIQRGKIHGCPILMLLLSDSTLSGNLAPSLYSLGCRTIAIAHESFGFSVVIKSYLSHSLLDDCV
jgi:hypothetical protein